MKVLQINSVIDYGSTGRIVRDLANVLESKGHECVVAFGRGKSTVGYNTIKIGNKFDLFKHLLYSRVADRHGFSSTKATKKLLLEIEKNQPDIIQLHNVHGYYFNIKIFFEYIKDKNIPVVWLLHDQWAVSGHGAYFDLDENGKVPKVLSNRSQLKEYPKSMMISQFNKNYNDKKRLFTLVDDMTVLTPSDWLRDIIKTTFLSKYLIASINNGIDTSVFKINNENTSRLKNEWKANNKVIILGVASIWDERKGLDDFIELSKLLDNRKYQIVLVGPTKKQIKEIPDHIICFDKTNNVTELVDMYNASDVFVNPTYFDNFPTVNIEALACGTPVITYDTGGSGESIDENTGSLVTQGSVKDLCKAIETFGKKNREVQYNCRLRSENLFDKAKVYNRYIELYEELLIHRKR